jgi:hypothetical protein
MTRTSSARRPVSTAWVGWVWFAAVMLIMTGSFNVIYGLVALFDDKYYTLSRQGLLVFDITQWGWILLVFGIVAIFGGIALFRGAMWARVVAVLLAGLNAIGHMAFMSAYPVWAMITIVIDVLVIYAVIAHGSEMKDETWD